MRGSGRHMAAMIALILSLLIAYMPVHASAITGVPARR